MRPLIMSSILSVLIGLSPLGALAQTAPASQPPSATQQPPAPSPPPATQPPPAPAAPAPPPPPPDWAGSFGAGLALTRGNSDTTSFNLSFDGTYDPKTRIVYKAQGSYLRAATDGVATANRLALQGRGEWTFAPRAYAFGQFQYLRDTFKDISYLVAPTFGAGYKIVDTPVTAFAVEASAGLIWERNPPLDVQFTGGITAGEKFSYKVSDTATVTESGQALWKTSDFGDALYTFNAGIQTQITSGSQLKLEILDTYKAKPPLTTKTNDVAVLATVIFKFQY